MYILNTHTYIFANTTTPCTLTRTLIYLCAITSRSSDPLQGWRTFRRVCISCSRDPHRARWYHTCHASLTTKLQRPCLPKEEIKDPGGNMWGDSNEGRRASNRTRDALAQCSFSLCLSLLFYSFFIQIYISFQRQSNNMILISYSSLMYIYLNTDLNV